MRRFMAPAAISLALLLASAGSALAASNPAGTGPPASGAGISCETQPSGPPGFDTAGHLNADAHYSSHSQYDIACYQHSQNHS